MVFSFHLDVRCLGRGVSVELWWVSMLSGALFEGNASKPGSADGPFEYTWEIPKYRQKAGVSSYNLLADVTSNRAGSEPVLLAK